MKVHLYSSPNGRIVAVDNCDKARDLLPAYGPPAPMFDGQPVPRLIVDAFLRQFGGVHVTGFSTETVAPETVQA